MNATERVPCPVCGSTVATQVRKAADICTCGECGVTYLRTRPPVKELEDWYQTYASAPGSHMKLPATVQAAKISPLRRDYFLKEVMEFTGSRKGKIIDIGCGWGAFLDNARDHGFEVEGNEICKQMAGYANNTLRISVWNAQLENCLFPIYSAKVITAIHSLEHLPNQRTALAFIHSLLEDGGLFCGIVPNFASFMSETQGDNWYWLDANFHYVQFTPETLRKTLHTYGFHAERIYTATDDFDANLIRRQLAVTNTRRTIEQLEADGRGEAIRFFARKI